MRITICCSVQEDVDNGPYRTYGLQMGAVRIGRYFDAQMYSDAFTAEA